MDKIYDETFKAGVYSDDDINAIMRVLTSITHKPSESESGLVNGDTGDFSYYTIIEKKIRIVLYAEP
jgi:hypothetical protein